MTRPLVRLLISAAFIATSSSAFAQLNPLAAIAHFESSYGTDVGSPPGSTASGVFQDVNGTWAQGLRLAGLNPAEFPTAGSSPVSVQFAANAALYNSRGFADWVCPGCDAKLTSYVAQQGGSGAFAHPGTLSTDPAYWAAQGVDTPAGLQAYFQANGGTDAGLASNAPIGQSPQAPPQATASVTTRPFSLFFAKIMNGVLPRVDAMVAQARGAVWPFFLAAAALSVAVLGVSTLLGHVPAAGGLGLAFRIALIAGILSPDGSGYFERWVEGPLLGLPVYFATLFSGNSAFDISSPAAFFDLVYNGLWASEIAIEHANPWYAVGTHFAALATTYLGAGALLLLFAAFLVGNFLVLLLLIITPFVLPALLFPVTRGYFKGWLDAVVTAMLTALLIDVLLSLYFGLIQDLLLAFGPSGSPITDLPGFTGQVMGLLLMGLTMVWIPKLSHQIGRGVSVATESAARHAAGLNIGSHASSAGRALGALHG